MECCFINDGDCDAYTVTPALVAQDHTPRHCEEALPKLPSCQKTLMYCYEEKPNKVLFCSEKKPKKVLYCSEKKPEKIMYCCEKKPQNVLYCREEPSGETGCSSPKRESPQKQSSCNNSEMCCKPVKTKYIVPCYRYEDGRIKNQPTVLMRRACEVAYGERPRCKPFIISSYQAEPDHEIRRFHSEDEKGNCCYHFERNKSMCCVPSDPVCDTCIPIGSCVSSPGYDYVQCSTADPHGVPCCYYCN